MSDDKKGLEQLGGGRLVGVTAVRGGVNPSYQISPQQRPPDPPPMKPATGTNQPATTPKKD
jgi:hypothetical protein